MQLDHLGNLERGERHRDYENLQGTGSLIGTYVPADACSAEGIDDHLTGVLRLP